MRVIIISNGFENEAREMPEDEVNLRHRDNGLHSQFLPKKITKKHSVHRNQTGRVLVYKVSYPFFSNPIWGKNRGGGRRRVTLHTFTGPTTDSKPCILKVNALCGFSYRLFSCLIRNTHKSIYTTVADRNFSVNRRRLLETFNKSFI